MAHFNYMDMEWKGVLRNIESDYFLKVLRDNFIMQTITEPITGNNILDFVLTSNDNFISELDVKHSLVVVTTWKLGAT